MLRTFWVKQFKPSPTKAQKTFDVTFGIVMPVVCLLADPAVFTGGRAGSSLLGAAHWRVFAHTLIALGCLILAVWLAREPWRNRMSQWVFGPFLLGGLLALCIGLILLFPALLLISVTIPRIFRLDGVIFVILAYGVLGLIPIFAAFAFLRNAARAFQARKSPYGNTSATIWIAGNVITVMAIMGVPYFFQQQTSAFVERNVQVVINGDTASAQGAIAELKRAFWCTSACYEAIARAYRDTEFDIQKAQLRAAYQALVGRDLELEFRGPSD
jgi:Co/Zn/Cd efflux system component